MIGDYVIIYYDDMPIKKNNLCASLACVDEKRDRKGGN